MKSDDLIKFNSFKEYKDLPWQRHLWGSSYLQPLAPRLHFLSNKTFETCKVYSHSSGERVSWRQQIKVWRLAEYQETYRSIQDEEHLLSEPLIILLVWPSTVFCYRVVNTQAKRWNEFHNKGGISMIRPEEVRFKLDC